MEKATEIARSLVKQFGMSEKLGPVVFEDNNNESMFMGKMGFETQNYSEKTAEEIDKEVSKFLEDARKRAEKILRQNKALLEKIAKVLIEKETIEREEFEQIIGRKSTTKPARAI